MKQRTIFPFRAGAPLVISGPCSAESEEQLVQTARALKAGGRTDLFRAGLWKPRTRPGSFTGAGDAGIPWMQRVVRETGLPVCTEVALPAHVECCLEAGIRHLWIGARTTSNPFSVQEIAEVLRGTDCAVMVKNPLHPDTDLWTGALERFQKAGLHRLAAIHRGFYPWEKTGLRNAPMWDLVIDMKNRFPELPFICDLSHISGRRENLGRIAQKALDLGMEGLMIECHHDPAHALSDAQQQITPQELVNLLDQLVFRQKKAGSRAPQNDLLRLREAIDATDEKILALLAQRMKTVEEIGRYKKEHNLPIFQVERWNEMMESWKQLGRKHGLSATAATRILQAIHQEAIRKLTLLYKKK